MNQAWKQVFVPTNLRKMFNAPYWYWFVDENAIRLFSFVHENVTRWFGTMVSSPTMNVKKTLSSLDMLATACPQKKTTEKTQPHPDKDNSPATYTPGHSILKCNQISLIFSALASKLHASYFLPQLKKQRHVNSTYSQLHVPESQSQYSQTQR